MSKLKKRGLERKGEKKQKTQDSKQMDENLVDLTKGKAESEELPEE
jgi:ubiquitin